VEIDPTRACELLVGLPDVDVVGVEDAACEPLRVHVRCRERDRWCRECGARAESKDPTSRNHVGIRGQLIPIRRVFDQNVNLHLIGLYVGVSLRVVISKGTTIHLLIIG